MSRFSAESSTITQVHFQLTHKQPLAVHKAMREACMNTQYEIKRISSHFSYIPPGQPLDRCWFQQSDSSVCSNQWAAHFHKNMHDSKCLEVLFARSCAETRRGSSQQWALSPKGPSVHHNNNNDLISGTTTASFSVENFVCDEFSRPSVVLLCWRSAYFVDVHVESTITSKPSFEGP